MRSARHTFLEADVGEPDLSPVRRRGLQRPVAPLAQPVENTLPGLQAERPAMVTVGTDRASGRYASMAASRNSASPAASAVIDFAPASGQGQVMVAVTPKTPESTRIHPSEGPHVNAYPRSFCAPNFSWGVGMPTALADALRGHVWAPPLRAAATAPIPGSSRSSSDGNASRRWSRACGQILARRAHCSCWCSPTSKGRGCETAGALDRGGRSIDRNGRRLRPLAEFHRPETFPTHTHTHTHAESRHAGRWMARPRVRSDGGASN